MLGSWTAWPAGDLQLETVFGSVHRTPQIGEVADLGQRRNPGYFDDSADESLNRSDIAGLPGLPQSVEQPLILLAALSEDPCTALQTVACDPCGRTLSTRRRGASHGLVSGSR